MASPIATTWANSTIRIDNEWGGMGTGFLVGRRVGADQTQLLIVTNKHVINQDPSLRSAAKTVKLHVNALQGDDVVGQVIDYPLVYTDGPGWREHPDPGVDVLAITAVPLFNGVPGLQNRCVPEEWFGTASRRAEMDVTAGEYVIVIGYPSGIRQGKTNHPLIRQGLIASRIGEELHEDGRLPDGSAVVRKSRGFLVDGATIPGSSGSPVVLAPVTGRYVHGNLHLGSNLPVLLGIIAETRFAPISTAGGPVPGFAGLGFAFDMETIVETIDLF